MFSAFLCSSVHLRHSGSICGPPTRPSRKNRNRVNRVNGVIDRWSGPGRSSRSQATLRAAAATDRRIAPARHGAMCPSPRRPTNTGATERNDDRMTSERPPSCRPQLFLLGSLRSFAAPFICANLRQSADSPAFPVRHSFSGGGSLLPCPSSASFVDFVASCETSLFARDLRPPLYLNLLPLCAFCLLPFAFPLAMSPSGLS